MIELHTWTTQNARKVAIMLEECGLDYHIRPVNLLKNEQKTPEFIKRFANGRIPAIVDHLEDGKEIAIFESGAILLYLAEKTDRFLPTDIVARSEIIQWLFWQMSALGPVMGNFAHFAAAIAPDADYVNDYLRMTRSDNVLEYPISRFLTESMRLLGVLESQLKEKDYIVENYSIADMACFTWVESSWAGFCVSNPDFEKQFSGIKSWMERIASRPSVAKVMEQFGWNSELTETSGSFKI